MNEWISLSFKCNDACNKYFIEIPKLWVNVLLRCPAQGVWEHSTSFDIQIDLRRTFKTRQKVLFNPFANSGKKNKTQAKKRQNIFLSLTFEQIWRFIRASLKASSYWLTKLYFLFIKCVCLKPVLKCLFLYLSRQMMLHQIAKELKWCKNNPVFLLTYWWKSRKLFFTPRVFLLGVTNLSWTTTRWKCLDPKWSGRGHYLIPQFNINDV